MSSASNSELADQGQANMIEMDLDVSDFASDWSNCDLMSSYVSKMVCHNRSDSLLFANLYSSALNELLETAFRVHGNSGKVICKFRRDGNKDRIELDLPSDENVAAFYQEAVDLTHQDNADSIYIDKLFSSDVPDKSLGLMELCVDYGADLSLQRDDTNGRLRLIADIVLEDTPS